MRTVTKSPGLIALGIVGCFAHACNKKSSNSPSGQPPPVGTETGTSGGDTSSATDTGTDNDTTENRLTVTGQLSLELNLNTAPTKGIVLYQLDGKSEVIGKTLIDVDANGNFNAEIQRDRSASIAKVIENGVVNRQLAKELFPTHQAAIDSATDQEIIEHFSEALNEMKENPTLRYVLISYDKSGDVEAEAASMQFIGLPTASSSLKMLPGDRLKGDLALGKIAGSGDEATSTLTAVDSVELPPSVIEEMAGASQTLKILKNDWMNQSGAAIVTPWFGYVTRDQEAAVNKFVTPTKTGTIFGGGSYYIHPHDIGATFGELCPPNPTNPEDVSENPYDATPAKVVTWHPPKDLDANFGPAKPYSSLSAKYKRSEQYGEIQCGKAGQDPAGGNLYMRASSEDATEFQLQLGAKFEGPAPVGLWRLKVDNQEVGRWDLAAAVPYDKDSDPVIYVPALKVVTNNSGIATAVEAKFYFYDKANKEFREVSDVAGLKSLVHSFNMDGKFNLNTAGGDLSVSKEQIEFGDDGIVRMELIDQYQVLFPCPSDNLSVQCIKNFGFSYFIGSISYRLSLSGAGNL